MELSLILAILTAIAPVTAYHDLDERQALFIRRPGSHHTGFDKLAARSPAADSRANHQELSAGLQKRGSCLGKCGSSQPSPPRRPVQPQSDGTGRSSRNSGPVAPSRSQPEGTPASARSRMRTSAPSTSRGGASTRSSLKRSQKRVSLGSIARKPGPAQQEASKQKTSRLAGWIPKSNDEGARKGFSTVAPYPGSIPGDPVRRTTSYQARPAAQQIESMTPRLGSDPQMIGTLLGPNFDHGRLLSSLESARTPTTPLSIGSPRSLNSRPSLSSAGSASSI